MSVTHVSSKVNMPAEHADRFDTSCGTFVYGYLRTTHMGGSLQYSQYLKIIQ